MSLSSHIHYRKSLTYAPLLNVLVNVYERLSHRLNDWVDSSQQPYELCALAGQIPSHLCKRYGRDITLKDIQRLLREAADFRDRFWKVMRKARCREDERSSGALEIVNVHMDFCHEQFDAHIRALRQLWFGPTSGEHVEDDWYFDVPVVERRQFLARQYAIAALLYVDAAQLAIVRHRNGYAAISYSLGGAAALRRAVEFDSLNAQQLRAEMARDAAVKRHRTSPKAAAKASVHGRYLNWKANREKHRSAAQFAVAMVNDFAVLESTQTVERWVRDWEKERRTPDKN